MEVPKLPRKKMASQSQVLKSKDKKTKREQKKGGCLIRCHSSGIFLQSQSFQLTLPRKLYHAACSYRTVKFDNWRQSIPRRTLCLGVSGQVHEQCGSQEPGPPVPPCDRSLFFKGKQTALDDGFPLKRFSSWEKFKDEGYLSRDQEYLAIISFIRDYRKDVPNVLKLINELCLRR